MDRYANQVNYLLHCAGYWFAAMNLLIHSIMYTYYALTSLGYRPQWNKYVVASRPPPPPPPPSTTPDLVESDSLSSSLSIII